ncbi:MAG TPA: peptidase T [Petrotogaceae bacterium]|jgi:tripeptide aminopeptidase|nr:peptidase T [Petrotogaceae bacterium]HNV04542.1 peptidase T [Petrotogaceae bacterium]HNY37089.1 peptidase T [Petrotogaceae bacterium]HOG34403.1 peptidase T [Petrotogaceae bacterium]HPX15583.1 peptidase T [Petrotogaceae bacterium]
MENLVKRFLEYVKIYTTSDEDSTTFPSTQRQKDLAVFLKKELEQLGLAEISLDHNGYLMATLPANTEEKIPVIGLIAHMDTSPEVSGENVKPMIIKYGGGDIVLNVEQNIVLKTLNFPEIEKYKGQTLITTDGTTLLGADDKAGIAEIITAVEYLINNPHIKHGKVRIGFTPDEEVGRGTEKFDIKAFGADFAYTVDGGPLGELEYENFNGASAEYILKGKSVHPGTSKDKMVNANLMVADLLALFPLAETPQNTEKYEGFYHVTKITGTVEQARVHFIIRDHDRQEFEYKKQICMRNAMIMKNKYGQDRVEVDIRDSYYNMKQIIQENMFIVDYAVKAFKQCGIEPHIVPIRGGTDGARLSYMGLPCPNIFTGGHNFHGRYEYIPVSSMEKAVQAIVEIIKVIAEK